MKKIELCGEDRIGVDLALRQGWRVMPLCHSNGFTLPVSSGAVHATTMAGYVNLLPAPEVGNPVYLGPAVSLGHGSDLLALRVGCMTGMHIVEGWAMRPHGFPRCPVMVRDRVFYFLFRNMPGFHGVRCIGLDVAVCGEGEWMMLPPASTPIGTAKWMVSPDQAPVKPVPLWLQAIINGHGLDGIEETFTVRQLRNMAEIAAEERRAVVYGRGGRHG